MANLIIVESPAKGNTIKSYLGSNYKVVASKGHVRDLPKSTLGVDIENNFAARYINIRGKGELINSLKKEAKKATKVFLATDPDREGEAISWHLAGTLGIPDEKVCRVTFNEITKTAIKDAIKNPRPIDLELVNSQQARRILDRIVGYKLSPFLWKNIKSGLSAGRVQSVTTRIIVEREAEIRAFVPQEYWTIDAKLRATDDTLVSARFYGDKNGRIKLENGDDAYKIVSATEGTEFIVKTVKKGTRTKSPAPPFITSTLQQEASRKLGFQSQRIMRVAQELYEGINLGSEYGGVQGLITYMRTDSLRVSSEAQGATAQYINEKYGADYVPATPRVYKSKNAQDAHEAIRPSDVNIEPQKIKKLLTSDQFRLYKLIWERFIASQMASAVLNTVLVEFESAGYIFRTSGYTVKFQGYMAVYEESVDETPKENDDENEKNMRIPEMSESDLLRAQNVDPVQHFTEPPPRYNEASLIKFLEEKGIGRPSTYTPIITTIIARDYVKREGKSLVPTPLGELTTRLMLEYFPDVVDYEFTANMEDKLDGIENGEDTLENVLKEFYKDFEKQLEEASEKVATGDFELPQEETDIICDKCGSRMIVKNGRFGKFAACPNYPECKNTKPLAKDGKTVAEQPKELEVADFKCELCGGEMVVRTGRYGSFYACANYPQCKFTKQRAKEIGVACPLCEASLVSKVGKNRMVFYSCERYPACDFSSWDLPTNEKCPDCGKMLFRKKGKNLIVCHDKKCGYKREIEPEDIKNTESADG